MNFETENALEALSLSENNTRNFTYRHIFQQQKKQKNNSSFFFCIMQIFLKQITNNKSSQHALQQG